ncbi:MAG: hypothetical protein H0S79_23080 [Anaerolineaceae bacterium]|nr:hypothetical protein [Anaerolineaceae bacterium]
MVPPLHRQTVALIVRVWAEYLEDQPPAWRGVIEGSEPGDINPFTSLDELTRIIQQKSLEETHPKTNQTD